MNYEDINLLAISGSLRPGSFNRGLLDAAGELTPEGVTLRIYDGYAGIPVFDESLESGPEPDSVAEFRSAISAADALLFATPEYNGSVPGGLKNAIDWASRPYGKSAFTGKSVIVAGASPSPYGAKWAQADLRRILGVAGAAVIDSELTAGPAAELFDGDGRLTDQSTRDALAERVQALVDAARRTEVTPTAV